MRNSTEARMLSLAAAMAATAGVSALAQAEEAHWFVGHSIGQTRANIDHKAIISDLEANGAIVNSFDKNAKDTGYKIFGGYRLGRYFDLEAGYFNLGEFNFTAKTTPTGALAGNIQLSGPFLDLVGKVPITERFSMFARVGVDQTKTRDTFSGTGAVNVMDAEKSSNRRGHKFGLGVQYELTPALGLRLEGERYRVDDATGHKGDIDLVSMGLVYRFGTKDPAPAVCPPLSPPPPRQSRKLSSPSRWR